MPEFHDTDIPNNALYLHEQEYGDTTRDSPNPFIGSTGYSSCAVILMYHPQKSAAIHIPAFTDLETLNAIVNKLYPTLHQITQTSKIQITLVGGSYSGAENFCEMLKDYFNKDIFDVTNKLGAQYALGPVVIDAKTGDIYHNTKNSPIAAANYTVTARNSASLNGLRNFYADKSKSKSALGVFVKTIEQGKIIPIHKEHEIAYVASETATYAQTKTPNLKL